jgi:hypothetical protein
MLKSQGESLLAIESLLWEHQNQIELYQTGPYFRIHGYKKGFSDFFGEVICKEALPNKILLHIINTCICFHKFDQT